MNVAAKPFLQFVKAKNLALDDQHDLGDYLVEVTFETASTEETFLASLTSEQQKALRQIKMKAREKTASLLLMSLSKVHGRIWQK